MSKSILIFSLLLLSNFLLAQNESNIWYFGRNVGVDFNSGTPVAINNGALNTLEGCATISDSQGNLLFYTNSDTVWNKNHNVMPNGSGLMGTFSTTQTAIVKKPGSNSIYYVLTLDALGGPNGFRYSEVDMNLQGGNGDVTSNKNILIVSPVCEKVLVARHQNNIDYWVIVHLFGSNIFHSYLLTSSGFNITPATSSVGATINSTQNTLGYMKVSLDRSRIASANTGGFQIPNTVDLFDFNSATGILSNSITLTNFPITMQPYGVEFSPNGKVLYVTDGTDPDLIQFDLLAGSATAINNSRVDINTGGFGIGALQMGPDLKIYRAVSFALDSSALGVINNPNVIGPGSNFVANGVPLDNKRVTLGLPPLINPSSFAVGIKDIIKPKQIIYPNPSSFKINIEISTKVDMIDIFDISGKLITSFSEHLNSLNISKLPNGVYFLRISSTDEIIIKKFVKQ